MVDEIFVSVCSHRALMTMHFMMVFLHALLRSLRQCYGCCSVNLLYHLIRFSISENELFFYEGIRHSEESLSLAIQVFENSYFFIIPIKLSDRMLPHTK